jgi:hypothetical protein
MKISEELSIIKLSPISFHLILKLKIGRKNALFIIDTGASQTLISKKFTEAQKLKTDKIDIENITLGIGEENLQPELTIIKHLKIKELTITNIPCIVLSIEHINSSYNSYGHKSIDGILGNDILFALESEILINKKLIKFKSKNNKFDFSEYIKKQV